MVQARLKTHIRVAAHLRRAHGAGAFASVARKGDPDAGAIAVKVYLGDRCARLFIQSRNLDGNLVWREPFDDDARDGRSEEKIDAFIERETRIDPDLWVIEIEDREGRAFLE